MVSFDRLLNQLVHSNPGPTVYQLIDLLFARKEYAAKIFVAIVGRAASSPLSDAQKLRIASHPNIADVLETLAESCELRGKAILKYVEDFGLENKVVIVDLVIQRIWRLKKIEIEFLVEVLKGEEGQAKKAWTVFTNVSPSNGHLREVLVNAPNPYKLEAGKSLLARAADYGEYEVVEGFCPELIPAVFAGMMKKQELSVATLVRFAATHKHEPAAQELLSRAKNGKLVHRDFDLIFTHLPDLHAEIVKNGWNEVRKTEEALADCLAHAY